MISPTKKKKHNSYQRVKVQIITSSLEKIAIAHKINNIKSIK